MLLALFVVVGGLHVLGAMGRASQKLFWHDEIITLTLAAQPLSHLWTGLLSGIDLNPPLYHLVLRSWHALVGEGYIASRLPSIAGSGVAALSMGLFVGRRLGVIGGCAAALVFLATGAYPYAYEARSYALVLGAVGAALVCWQAAASNVARPWCVAGLLACSAAAISLHYYAVLFLPALVAAEVARTLESRKPDRPVWLVLSACVLPLVLFLPLIVTARRLAPAYFAVWRVEAIFEVYRFAFAPMLVPLIVVLAAVAGAVAWSRTDVPPSSSGARAVPIAEWTLAIGLLAVPLLGFAVAALVTGAFVHRYFLIVTLGFSMLVTFVAAALSNTRPPALVLLACVLLSWVAARDVASASLLLRGRPDIKTVYPSLIERAGGDLPIVITHGHVFAAVVHHAPDSVSSRVRYLYQPVDLRRASEATYLTGLSRWNARMRAENVDEFLRHHRRFLVYEPMPSPFVTDVLRSGGRVTLLAVDVDRSLFAVSRPGPCSLLDVSLEDGKSLLVPDRARPEEAGIPRDGDTNADPP